MRTLGRALLVATLASATGCGTIGSMAAGVGPGPYYGTVIDLMVIDGQTFLPWIDRSVGRWLSAFDLPFSAVADTALLPITIPWFFLDDHEPEARPSPPAPPGPPGQPGSETKPG